MKRTLETRRIGKTDLVVPRLGVGTAPIGNLYRPVPEEQAIEMIRWSLKNGMNFFDTAPLYGAGEAERRVGLALADQPRDGFVLQTKVGRLVRDDGSIYFDFSRDGVLRSLDESRERMGIDRIDSVLIHDPDVETPEEHFRQVVDEALPTLIEQREAGIIGAVGAGMNQWEMEWEFAKNADVNGFLLAGRYTLLEQTSLDFLTYCHENQISVYLGGVYNSGILATGPQPGAKYNYADAPAEIMEKVGKIEQICQNHGVPLRVAALHFAAAHPAVTSLVLGSVSRAEAEDNRAIWEAPIPTDLWTDLRQAGLIDPAAPTADA